MGLNLSDVEAKFREVLRGVRIPFVYGRSGIRFLILALQLSGRPPKKSALSWFWTPKGG